MRNERFREAIHDDILEAPEAGTVKVLVASPAQDDQDESESGSTVGDRATSPT